MAKADKERGRSGARTAARPARHSRAHDFIIFKIGILRRLIERYANPAITEGHGTTVAEWRVLTHLYADSPLTASELSQRLCADKAEVSRACQSLIAKGYVKRTPDADDRRSLRLAITRSGETLHDRILPLRQTLQDELAAILTASEQQTLHRALDKLIAHLIARVRQAAPAPQPRAAGKRAARAQAIGRSPRKA